MEKRFNKTWESSNNSGMCTYKLADPKNMFDYMVKHVKKLCIYNGFDKWSSNIRKITSSISNNSKRKPSLGIC